VRGRSNVVAQVHVPNWTITKGHYEGKDAIAVLESYLPALDSLLLLAQAYV